MGNRQTIGELATAVGVPTSTIRYYERSGLMKPAERTESNYRIYDDVTLERLRFIRAAQASGLTLIDIKTLLEYRDGVTAPCREVRVLIEKRLDQIQERMREFRHVEHVLKSYLDICQKAEEDEPCQVLDRMGSARSKGRRPRGNAPRKKSENSS